MNAIIDDGACAGHPALHSKPRKGFVATPSIGHLTERAVAFLNAGYPVHFRGPAGTGKTTMAFHVANRLGRPIMLITGDDEFGSSDLIGGHNGFHSRRVIDRYIHSVTKVEEDVSRKWVDQRLTTACAEGYTLVYDEFTRSRPAANNVLLSVLEERILVLPTNERSESYVKVHPNFRAIFTSNPQDYAGVHQAQDALTDRLVTMDVDGYDIVTEVAITVGRSGIDIENAVKIVNIVRRFRQTGTYVQAPTIRASIMIARVVTMNGMTVSASDARFVQVCLDVLSAKLAYDGKVPAARGDAQRGLADLIRQRADLPLGRKVA